MRLAPLIAVAAAALVAGCKTEAPAQSPEAREPRDTIRLEPGSPHLEFLKVEEVKEAESAASVALTGKVDFDEDHTQRVSSPIDGRVLALLVHNGDKVRAGQELLQLSSPQVGVIQADAQKAQSDFLVAQKAVDRSHQLKESGAASEKDVAQAEADFRKAHSDVARTTAQLKSLGISASEPEVAVALRAQVSGTVVDRTVLVGQEVRADQSAPLLTISNLDTVRVLADVYEQDLGQVQKGDEVAVRVPAYPGESFLGKVAYIGDVVDPTSRTVKIRCMVPNPKARLKPEMFARIELRNTSGRKVIELPIRAILTDGDQARVIVSTGNNVFRARKVEVGPELDGRVRVLSGLALGERIVTDGALFLKHELDSQ